MQLVFLSTARNRIEAVRAAAKRNGLGCTLIASQDQASAAMNVSTGGILVVDAETTPQLQQVLAARLPGWPILVIARQFDSSAWVEWFKAGAAEVISDPLDAAKLDAALDGFLTSGTETPSNVLSALARRFRTQVR
jgi:DNA-binding NtrC family response regulator